MTKTIRIAPSWFCISNGVGIGRAARQWVKKRRTINREQSARDWGYVRFLYRFGWCSVGLVETRWQQEFPFWTWDGNPTAFPHIQCTTYTSFRAGGAWLLHALILPHQPFRCVNDTESFCPPVYDASLMFRITKAWKRKRQIWYFDWTVSSFRVAGVHLSPLDSSTHRNLLAKSCPCPTLLIRVSDIHPIPLPKQDVALIAVFTTLFFAHQSPAEYQLCGTGSWNTGRGKHDHVNAFAHLRRQYDKQCYGVWWRRFEALRQVVDAANVVVLDSILYNIDGPKTYLKARFTWRWVLSW